jgi:predicted flap endonuclease-1-like 5' DNA nuclease
MTLSIKDIEGIGDKFASKMVSEGIKTTDDLLKAAKTPKQRDELAKKTGISAKLILGWTNKADLI